VYRREIPLGYFRNYGDEFAWPNPRFFLHDIGTYSFTNCRILWEDLVRIRHASTGPPFQFFHSAVTPDKLFHDDVQLNTPDLPGQPACSDSWEFFFTEANEHWHDSYVPESFDESDWHTQWARDLKWGQESELVIESTRRTIWRSDRWGIEFSLEVKPYAINLPFR